MNGTVFPGIRRAVYALFVLGHHACLLSTTTTTTIATFKQNGDRDETMEAESVITHIVAEDTLQPTGFEMDDAFEVLDTY